MCHVPDGYGGGVSMTKISFPESGLKPYLLVYSSELAECSDCIFFSRSTDQRFSLSLGVGMCLTGPMLVNNTGPTRPLLHRYQTNALQN